MILREEIQLELFQFCASTCKSLSETCEFHSSGSVFSYTFPLFSIIISIQSYYCDSEVFILYCSIYFVIGMTIFNTKFKMRKIYFLAIIICFISWLLLKIILYKKGKVSKIIYSGYQVLWVGHWWDHLLKHERWVEERFGGKWFRVQF